ncbi:hypothetical protein CRG98_032249 [Punica granatum]|uniref:Uncharacterized protein n=1 Tax=Punica granatum TaxID=22663 RepID=A0A2I0ITU3_PUNGR|nr:hypothetical protein CRG98_032249 [Punica granatum]
MTVDWIPGMKNMRSHIGAMLKLVTLLHHQALCITFVNTEFNHKRMLDAEGPMFLSDLPVGLQFVAIPNLLPLVPHGSSILHSRRRSERDGGFWFGLNPTSLLPHGGRFHDILAYPASEKFGIPVVNLWTIAVCALMGLMHYPKLKEKGLTPPKGAWSPVRDPHPWVRSPENSGGDGHLILGGGATDNPLP